MYSSNICVTVKTDLLDTAILLITLFQTALLSRMRVVSLLRAKHEFTNYRTAPRMTNRRKKWHKSQFRL